MTDELRRAKVQLEQNGYTLFLCAGERTYCSKENGIVPLLALVGSNEWKGAYAADKIVGKAAAMLYVLLGVKAVYAEVLSKTAQAVFEEYGVAYAYGTLTEKIINRMGTGLCPMELAVSELEKPADAPEAIRAKLVELRDK